MSPTEPIHERRSCMFCHISPTTVRWFVSGAVMLLISAILGWGMISVLEKRQNDTDQKIETTQTTIAGTREAVVGLQVGMNGMMATMERIEAKVDAHNIKDVK